MVCRWNTKAPTKSLRSSQHAPLAPAWPELNFLNYQNENINGSMTKFGDTFTSATRHLAELHWSDIKNYKCYPWKQRTCKERKSKSWFYRGFSLWQQCSFQGCIRPLTRVGWEIKSTLEGTLFIQTLLHSDNATLNMLFAHILAHGLITVILLTSPSFLVYLEINLLFLLYITC